MGEAVKYCGHFFPPQWSLYLAQISMRQNTVSQWPSDIHQMSTLYSHAWKETQLKRGKSQPLKHLAVMEMKTWKSPILEELHYRNQEITGTM